MASFTEDKSRRLRQDENVVRECLNRLDESQGAADTCNRQDNRYTYRVRSLSVDFPQQGGDWMRYVVPTRNISRQGVAFLIGHFIYPGTPCRVHLVSVQNHAQVFTANVVRCRYLSGTASLHEVGVKFTKPIDVEMFHREASVLKCLLADEDEAVHRLIQRQLQHRNIKLTCVRDGNEAVASALSCDYDVVLMNKQMPGLDGIEAVRKLRSEGYLSPVIAIIDEADAGHREACLEAGFTTWLTKPISCESLVTTVMSMKDEPLISSHVQDDSMLEMIDRFVEELPKRVRELEALRTDHLDILLGSTRDLKSDAIRSGFDSINHVASELEKLIGTKDAVTHVRSKLNQLTRLCLAAPPATCTPKE